MNSKDNTYRIGVNNLGNSIYYESDFVCTYTLIKDFDDSLFCYRIQLLQAFSCNQFDENIINNTSNYLYEKYKDNEYIKNIILKNKNKLNLDVENKEIDKLSIFRSLFSYDNFYLFHSILCSLINNTNIDEKKYNNLIE
tara:strand:+ start:1176 stop:1592 length:417 start_codon:yes stop_codon:yes gene_type:complete